MTGYVARVTVGLRPGVADPEGDNTAKTLHLLGFGAVQEVHTKKVYEVTLEAASPEEAKQQAQDMCAQLLANPVVNTTEVEVAPLAV